METETSTTPTTLDLHVAGRPYPQLQPDLNPTQVRTVFQDRREWWQDVAQGFLSAAQSAGSLGQPWLSAVWLARAEKAVRASREYRTVTA